MHLDIFVSGLLVLLDVLLDLPVPEAHLGVEVDLKLAVRLLHLLGNAEVRIHTLAASLQL